MFRTLKRDIVHRSRDSIKVLKEEGRNCSFRLAVFLFHFISATYFFFILGVEIINLGLLPIEAVNDTPN
jgi:hypothetical protein